MGAITTYDTHLRWKAHATSGTPSTMTEMVIIKDFPDMIGTPNLVDCTTLSDSQQTNLAGIKTSSVLTFNCNLQSSYTTSDPSLTSQVTSNLDIVLATEDVEMDYELEFSNGIKLTWTGYHRFGIPGGGVDAAVGLTVNVVNTTPIKITPAA